MIMEDICGAITSEIRSCFNDRLVEQRTTFDNLFVYISKTSGGEWKTLSLQIRNEDIELTTNCYSSMISKITNIELADPMLMEKTIGIIESYLDDVDKFHEEIVIRK